MIRRFSVLAVLAVLAFLAVLGCERGQQIPAGLPAQTPLSVAEWKALDVPEKYDPWTYERLQLGDPKLKDPSAWRKFEQDVIGPEFKKDHPAP